MSVGVLDAEGLELEGLQLLGVLDCGDCIELVFSESGRRPNLVTFWMDGRHCGLVSPGGVADAVEYVRDYRRWLEEAA